MKTEKELKEEIEKRNKIHRRKGRELGINLSDGNWNDTIELEAQLKTLQERNAEVKEIIEDVKAYGETLRKVQRTHCNIRWDKIFLLRLKKELLQK